LIYFHSSFKRPPFEKSPFVSIQKLPYGMDPVLGPVRGEMMLPASMLLFLILATQSCFIANDMASVRLDISLLSLPHTPRTLTATLISICPRRLPPLTWIRRLHNAAWTHSTRCNHHSIRLPWPPPQRRGASNAPGHRHAVVATSTASACRALPRHVVLQTCVANVCFMCFKGMLQIFYIDVEDVDLDVAHVAMVIHICCKNLFKMFHLFQTYVANILSRYCMCCNGYVAIVQNVSSVLNVCCNCFISVLQK
jgi:hypothetical protein